jgi:flagellar biosynthesis/type III secretory pathway chaperone
MSRSSELLLLVDKEIELLQQKVKMLDAMRACVTASSLEALEELVEQEGLVDIETRDVEKQMRHLCREIGASLGLRPTEATLDGIARKLPGADGIAMRDRRQRLVLTVQQVQETSVATSMVVQQALEVNDRLLTALLGTGGQAETYCPAGTVARSRQGVTFQHSV